MKPHLFGEAQREEIIADLERLDVGDEEGRRIFVYALEYELAQFELQRSSEPSAQTPAPPAVTDRWSALKSTAEALLSTLRGMDAAERTALLDTLSATDRFDRTHEHRYLTALEAELARLGELPTVREPPPNDPPTISTAERRFVQTLAKAYHDCFEIPATAAARGPFARLIATVLPPLGIDLRLGPGQLREILGQGR
jgi:hypothetical protein